MLSPALIWLAVLASGAVYGGAVTLIVVAVLGLIIGVLRALRARR